MELMVGGFGWVKNLTAADQYFILPVSIALTNLAIMEVCFLCTIFHYYGLFYQSKFISVLGACSFESCTVHKI